MITIPPLPEIKQLCRKRKTIFPYADNWNIPDGIILELAKTQHSLVLIIRWYMEFINQGEINLWVPDYFCDETLMPIKNMDYVNIIYYPIDCTMEPAWSECNNIAQFHKPSIYIGVHYFGKCCDISRAAEWCKKFHALLIEDCAHVLLPDNKIGRTGDFILFSAHKLLAIPSGAFLIYNPKCLNQYFFTENAADALLESYNQLPQEKNDWIWLIKRLLQKFLFKQKPSKNWDIYSSNNEINDLQLNKISVLSTSLLLKYTQTDLRKITAIRQRNLGTMNYIMSKEYHLNYILNDISAYLGLYQYEPDDFKKNRLFLSKGFLLQKWPTLPEEIMNSNSGHMTALKITAESFTLPVHQSIKRQELIKRYTQKIPILYSKNIVMNECASHEAWDEIFYKIPYSALTQDWYYGAAKHLEENAQIERFAIYKDSKPIGLMQILIKIKFGIKLIRINRGPLLFPEYKNIETISSILNLLRYHYKNKGVCIIFLNPELEDSYDFIKFFTDMKWKEWRHTCYESGWIDLPQDSGLLYVSLKSKWRNQLKAAVKKGIAIKKYTDAIENLIELYEINMKQKCFKGISPSLIKRIYTINPDSLLILGAYKQEKMIAFDIAYMHGSSMTYLIGWTSEEGRKCYANNYLLYSLAENGAKLNISFFDMGGMDIIETPEIAKFKSGLNPNKYRLLGEFYHIKL